MATSGFQRFSKWDAKFDTERVKAILDDLRPGMLVEAQVVFDNIATMEAEVKQVLDGSGIATIMYPFYLAYGRELFRLQRNGISGESLALEAQVLLNKWVARGLTQSVLEAVRTQVFNIAAPVGP